MTRGKKRYTLADAHKWCGNGENEPLRMVQMFDRDAIGEWRDKAFVFRSDKLAQADKLEMVKIALSIRWPKLEVLHDGNLVKCVPQYK